MANVLTAGNSSNGGTAISTDTSGTLNIVTGSGSGSNAITIDASQNVVFSGNVSGNIKSGTSVSASGTSVDFTGIPSTAKRITVMLSGISTNGSSFYALRVGTSSGVVSTGYAGGAGDIYTANNVATNGSATEIALQGGAPASGDANNGVITIVNLSGNIWSYSGNIYRTAGTSRSTTTAGTVTLSAALDRVRLTTINGTDTFDAGTINILYE